MRWTRLAGLLAVALLSACGSDAAPSAAKDDVASIETSQPPAPAAQAPRVVVAIGTTILSDGHPRELQQTVYAALRRFGLRVDCLAPFKDPALEAAAREESARGDPDAPVVLRITGETKAEYDDSAFYGQALAHNFHGEVDLQVADGEGQPLRRIAFTHSWGRLRQSRSLEQTLDDWEAAVHGTVLVGIMSEPTLRAAVPEGRRAELDAWIEGERQRLLDRLERSIPESEVVAALRGYAPPD